MKYIHLISSYLLGVVFLLTSVDKLFHYNEFLNALASYVLMPAVMVPYFALPLILTELWIGVGLLIKRWRRPAAITLLLSIFTLALILSYIHQPGAICGCWFTITLGKATEMHIAQNLVMFSLALTVWSLERGLTKKSVTGAAHLVVSS